MARRVVGLKKPLERVRFSLKIISRETAKCCMENSREAQANPCSSMKYCPIFNQVSTEINDNNGNSRTTYQCNQSVTPTIRSVIQQGVLCERNQTDRNNFRRNRFALHNREERYYIPSSGISYNDDRYLTQCDSEIRESLSVYQGEAGFIRNRITLLWENGFQASELLTIAAVSQIHLKNLRSNFINNILLQNETENNDILEVFERSLSLCRNQEDLHGLLESLIDNIPIFSSLDISVDNLQECFRSTGTSWGWEKQTHENEVADKSVPKSFAEYIARKLILVFFASRNVFCLTQKQFTPESSDQTTFTGGGSVINADEVYYKNLIDYLAIDGRLASSNSALNLNAVFVCQNNDEICRLFDNRDSILYNHPTRQHVVSCIDCQW